MEKQLFFRTKAVQLTLVFVAILIAFMLLLIGLYQDNDILYLIGIAMIMISMLYSPLKKLVLKSQIN